MDTNETLSKEGLNNFEEFVAILKNYLRNVNDLNFERFGNSLVDVVSIAIAVEKKDRYLRSLPSIKPGEKVKFTQSCPVRGEPSKDAVFKHGGWREPAKEVTGVVIDSTYKLLLVDGDTPYVPCRANGNTTLWPVRPDNATIL